MARLTRLLAVVLLVVLLPPLTADDTSPNLLRYGRSGTLSNTWEYRVLQIIDKENMLVMASTKEFGQLEFKTFWLRGYSTDRLVDDKQFTPDGVFNNAGAIDYTSALGAKRRVILVERETAEQGAARGKANADKFKAHLAKRAREAEEKRLAEERLEKEAFAKTQADAERKATLAAAKAEAASAAKLSLCKQLLDLAKTKPDKLDVARFRLEELVRDYPRTKAAEEARMLLKKL